MKIQTTSVLERKTLKIIMSSKDLFSLTVDKGVRQSGELMVARKAAFGFSFCLGSAENTLE